MADNPLTLEKMLRGSQNLEVWDAATNGDENTDWTNLVGDKGPSLKKAIKTIMQKAPINSTPFATKSALLADTTLADNAFAYVYNDTTDTNNGVYQKISGAWTYLKANLASSVNQNTASISSLQKTALINNLVPNKMLTSSAASSYQATNSTDGGYGVATLDANSTSLVAYDMLVDNYIKPDATLTFSIDVFSDTVGNNSCDITIQALYGSTVVATSTAAYPTTANAWQTIKTSLKLPSNTTKIKLRMVRRTGAVTKFRNPILTSDVAYFNQLNFAAANSPSIVYVAKHGNDTNSGLLYTTPFLTIQAAVDAIEASGGIIEIAGGEYRESVDISSSAHVWLRSKKDQRVKIFGSDQLTVTKTSGFTQVYQAPLANKPKGIGAGRGLPVIFEWGAPSKAIAENERHFLHRGHTHRLPYTGMFEAASKADLDTVGGRGKWFWESGIIYFAATDGGDATTKRYEARVRNTLKHSNGSIRLTRIDTYFSSSEGGLFSGVSTQREDCKTFGNYYNGFSDNANTTLSYRDESGGNGNDGFNGTVTAYNDSNDDTTRLEAVYFDPYGHDNGDDGLSYHYRGDVTIYGGLFEYNTKADVVHVTGAACVCYNTVARGTLNGFYAATATTGDTTRVKTSFRCVNTIAYNNTYSYRAADDAVLDCVDAKAFNPTGYGYYQTGAGTLNAIDCKYVGDSAKAKSGNVSVTTTNALT